MSDPEEYVLTVRKKSKTPTWLAPYRERMHQALRRAAEETRHLKGSPLRPIAMNLLTSKYFHEDQE